jgi:hypothetical protein
VGASAVTIVRVGRADEGLATVEAADGHTGGDVDDCAGDAEAGVRVAELATVSGAGGVTLIADVADLAQRDALVAILAAN